MPSTAGVGKQAQQIQTVFGNTVSIQNVGPGDVFLGSDASVNPSNGWLLPARGMGSWTGGTQLWACTAGGTSELRIADSALAYFTPGPDHVTIDGGTVNIGNASIPITGSVDIASGTINAQITGPVDINGSTVNVGNAVALSNDYRPLLSSQPVPVSGNNALLAFSAAGGAYGALSSSIATGGNVRSLRLQAAGNQATTTPTNRVAQVTIYWDDSTGTTLSTDTCAYWYDGSFEWNVPVKSQYFRIVWTNVVNGQVLGVSISVSNTSTDRTYSSDPNNNGSSAIQGGSATANFFPSGPYGLALFDVTATAADVNYSQILLPSRSGMCSIKASSSDTTTASALEVKALGNGWTLTAAAATVWAASVGATSIDSFVVPESPLLLQVRSTVTTGTKRWYGALTWTH